MALLLYLQEAGAQYSQSPMNAGADGDGETVRQDSRKRESFINHYGHSQTKAENRPVSPIRKARRWGVGLIVNIYLETGNAAN